MTEKEFGERVAFLRMAKGVSARDMSLSIGQNPGYINSIETGRTTPSLAGIFYICDYFGITPAELFDIENPYPSHMHELMNDLQKLSKDELGHFSAIVRALVNAKQTHRS